MAKPQRYRGVRQRHWGSWVSEIRHPLLKTRVWLGTYESQEAAARAYDEAARLMCGSTARTNFPEAPPASSSSANATTPSLLPAPLVHKLRCCYLASQDLMHLRSSQHSNPISVSSHPEPFTSAYLVQSKMMDSENSSSCLNTPYQALDSNASITTCLNQPSQVLDSDGSSIRCVMFPHQVLSLSSRSTSCLSQPYQVVDSNGSSPRSIMLPRQTLDSSNCSDTHCLILASPAAHSNGMTGCLIKAPETVHGNHGIGCPDTEINDAQPFKSQDHCFYVSTQQQRYDHHETSHSVGLQISGESFSPIITDCSTSMGCTDDLGQDVYQLFTADDYSQHSSNSLDLTPKYCSMIGDSHCFEMFQELFCQSSYYDLQ